MTSSPVPPGRSALAVWVGLLTLYFVWGSTYIGIKVSVESIPAVPHGRRSGSCSPGCCCSAGAWPVTARAALRDHPDRVPRLLRRRRAAPRSAGMGMVALGEQTVPAGITALLIALMPLWVAVLGRVVFGERRRAVVARRHRHRPRRRRHPRRPDRRRRPGPSSRRDRRCPRSRPLSWASGSLYSSHRARLPHLPLDGDRRADVCGGALVLGGLSLVTGELTHVLARRGDRPVVAGLRVPRDGRQRDRLHDVRLDAPGRATAEDRDVRLRQPDRRVRPQRDRARRDDRPRGPWWPPSSSSRRSRSSSRRAAARRAPTTPSPRSRSANPPSTSSSTESRRRAHDRSPREPPPPRRASSPAVPSSTTELAG